MNGPAESLREDLARIDHALEPFSTPVSDERPGLRWMAQVLRSRRAHVMENLRQAETTRLEVTATSAEGVLTATTLAALLEAVQAGVFAAGGGSGGSGSAATRRALTLQPVGLEASAPSDGAEHAWHLTLSRLPGPHATQPVDDDGELVVDAAVTAFVESAARGEAEPLTEVVRHHGLAVELTAVPVLGDGAHATVEQGGPSG